LKSREEIVKRIEELKEMERDMFLPYWRRMEAKIMRKALEWVLE